MSIRLPQSRWSQPNSSDKFGSLWYTKNCNFDEEGYLKLSPRMVRLYSDNDDNDFGLPLAIGRQADGEYQIMTNDANWGIVISTTGKTFSEDSGTDAPATTFNSDGVWFQGLWHVSTATAVLSRPATGGASEAWTSRITGLLDSDPSLAVRHVMAVHGVTRTLCVANGNVVKQYNTSYANTTDLTIPSDFEISGMAYNNGKLGIITRLTNNGTVGQDQEAKFYIWDGALTSANLDAGLGSDAGVAVCAYKSSFVVLTRSGELKYWNGGGFDTLAAFPFYFTADIYGDAQDNNALGNVFVQVEGDVIYLNIGIDLEPYGIKQERTRLNTPSGIWCFDPKVGLYHKWSPSNSPVTVMTVVDSNINTSTNVLTVSSGTVPATGNVARLTNSVGIGGLTLYNDYYIIKTGATTFKLATTKENALAGVAIDITSAATGSNYFWMFDFVDYGTSYYSNPAAIKVTGDRKPVYQEIITGGHLNDTDVTNVETLSVAVPGLENRGYFVSPRLFSSQERDTAQKMSIRFRPLGSRDSIVVYVRVRDVYGIPVSTPNSHATWTGSHEAYTTKDISEAETFINAGGSLVAEIISGTGAGQIVQITSITEDNGTYALDFAEDVIGASAGLKCEFIIHNWEVVGTITDDDNDDAEKEFTIDVPNAKFAQFMVEMRGSDITIEDVLYTNTTFQPIA